MENYVGAISFDGNSITFRCPWCGVAATHVIRAKTICNLPGEIGILAECQNRNHCGKPSLVIASATTQNRRTVHEALELHPMAKVMFTMEGVPPEIEADFQEALRCSDANLK